MKNIVIQCNMFMKHSIIYIIEQNTVEKELKVSINNLVSEVVKLTRDYQIQNIYVKGNKHYAEKYLTELKSACNKIINIELIK